LQKIDFALQSVKAVTIGSKKMKNVSNAIRYRVDSAKITQMYVNDRLKLEDLRSTK